MKITVVGTGYVGLSLAVLLSRKYTVDAVDVEQVLHFSQWRPASYTVLRDLFENLLEQGIMQGHCPRLEQRHIFFQ